jgi:hypothetical protein
MRKGGGSGSRQVNLATNILMIDSGAQIIYKKNMRVMCTIYRV